MLGGAALGPVVVCGGAGACTIGASVGGAVVTTGAPGAESAETESFGYNSGPVVTATLSGSGVVLGTVPPAEFHPGQETTGSEGRGSWSAGESGTTTGG